MIRVSSLSVSSPLLECWQQLSDTEILCLGLRMPDYSPDLEECLKQWVSDAERRQTRRFHYHNDRLRYLLGRTILRQTVAYPDREFSIDKWGKPFLPDMDIHFNISHGGQEVWIALSKRADVGIDVEEEDISDVEDLLDNLHPQEAAAIRSLPPDQATIAFCRCWTRKEAVLKALGQGLSMPLADFQVAIDNRPADWLLQAPGASKHAWTTLNLPVSRGHRGSVAALAANQTIKVLKIAIDPGSNSRPLIFVI